MRRSEGAEARRNSDLLPATTPTCCCERPPRPAAASEVKIISEEVQGRKALEEELWWLTCHRRHPQVCSGSGGCRLATRSPSREAHLPSLLAVQNCLGTSLGGCMLHLFHLGARVGLPSPLVWPVSPPRRAPGSPQCCPVGTPSPLASPGYRSHPGEGRHPTSTYVPDGWRLCKLLWPRRTSRLIGVVDHHCDLEATIQALVDFNIERFKSY